MNKKKAILYLSLWAILSNTVFAQNNQNSSISGKLLDNVSNEAVEYASVVLYSLPDTVMITGVITNHEGVFSFEKIPLGNYLIKSSFIGYETFTQTIKVDNTPFQFPEALYMTPASFSLDEVVVSASRSEKKITVEKTKVNVAQSMSQVSGNITDILKNLSGVNMDAEGNLYLRGNKNILVLIDGVPTTATSLTSMPSSSVDNIEIITNPDVKYDAEGTGGIINIVTKRDNNTQGASGRVTLNYGLYDKINGGMNLQIKKGIWGLDLSYNGRYENTQIKSDLTRNLHAQNTLLEQQIEANQTNNMHTAALLLSAIPNNTESYTLTLRGMFPQLINEQSIHGTQTKSPADKTLFNRRNEITFTRKVVEAAFSYKKTFEKNRHELSFDAALSRTKGKRPAEYFVEDILTQKSSGGGAPTNATLQTDYMKSVSKNGKIESGIKGFVRWNNFEYNFYDSDAQSNQWIVNPTFSNDLEHREYIYSAYLMYSDSLARNLFFKIGARLEYSTSNLLQKSINETIDKQFWHPFPYLQLQYNISETQNLALTLNRRITRPTYPQLNPIINVIDHTLYETGNKDLNPETSDKVEISHSLIGQKLQLRTGLFFSTTQNYITQVTLLSSPDKLILTYINGKRENKTGGNIDANYNVNKYLSINPVFSIFHSQTTGQYNEIDLSTNSFAWTGNMKLTIKPEKQTEIQAFFNYNSPVTLPQFKLGQIHYMDVSVKRTFLKNKLTASLTVTDIFNTNKWNIISDNNIYYLRNNSKSETRILWLGLAYNFNAYKPNSKMQRSSGENDNNIIKLGQ